MKPVSVPEIELIESIEVSQRTLEIGKKFVILPKLHNLFFKEGGPKGEKGVSSANLEFGFFGWGTEIEGARECLNAMVDVYFTSRIKNEELDEILEDAGSSFMEPYWSLYRKLSIKEAARGEISTISKLISSLKKQREQKKSLKVKNNDAERIIHAMEEQIDLLTRENKLLKDLSPPYLNISQLLQEKQEAFAV